jgi:hypothetical protein
MKEPNALTITLSEDQVAALIDLMNFAIEGKRIADEIRHLDAALASAINAAGVMRNE